MASLWVLALKSYDSFTPAQLTYIHDLTHIVAMKMILLVGSFDL